MASFIRGKQSGMQNDLSANIVPELFAPDDRSRYGVNSQISCIAFEPVQSLIAVGTKESKFGSGRIDVYGQNRVHKFLIPPRPCSFADLQFTANRLVSLDTKNEILIWDLDTGKRLAGFHAPGIVTRMVTDPMLDWCFVGNQNGEIYAYDLDRERLSSLKLPNFWVDRDSRARAVGLVTMQMHPRDVGKLLIAYTHGVVVYSFKQEKPTQFFEYQVPPGAPGGNGVAVDSMRRPRITHALWHPTGTFILTAHEDGSLVFWDTQKDCRVVMARTLTDNNVDKPVPNPAKTGPKAPYIKIAWCCKQSNPEDTSLLIAGGQPIDNDAKGLTFIDMGVTPVYATSSWQVLSDYCKGSKQSNLEVPLGVEVTDFCLIPRWSPHFAGAQDPIAVVTLLSSGELLTMSFPSGYHISPTNQLHPSLSFVHPYAVKFAVATVDRGRWLGMVETRNQGEPLLKGGAEAPKPRRKFEGRSIIQVAHADGTIRIWDVGQGDAIENPAQLQVDIARAVNRYDDVRVTAMSMASNTGEFVAGTSQGEVVIYRWGGNQVYGRNESLELKSNPGGLTDISVRAEPALKQGLQPFSLYEMMQGPISAVKVSDVGFVAAGSEKGFLSIVDMRGPAVIYQESMTQFTKQDKHKSFRRHSMLAAPADYPVVIEFGVMTLDDDKYSSICCFVGTNLGKIITLVLLPGSGGYNVKVAGVTQMDGRVVSLCPIVADTGKPAGATGAIVAGLREGKQVNGLLVAVTEKEVRIFRPATAKGASKDFDDYHCHAAAVTECDLHGMALVGIFGDRVARAFSLPGLKEVGSALLKPMDGSRGSDSVVTEDGSLFVWTDLAEIAILDCWGAGRDIENTADTLINPTLKVPPRPTISNMQWISGTQYISPADLDLLIGGADRPPSKRMLSAERRAMAAGEAGPSSLQARVNSNEGWGEYLTRQLNERTEKLNLVNDAMDNAADASQRWAEDASKWANKQKRNLVLGSITSKFS